MDGRNVVDVSSFWLFEASGDSEADCDLNMEAVNREMDGGDDDDDDDDDAQSCSYDSSDCTRVMEFDGYDDDDDDDDYDDYDEEEDPDYEDWAGDDNPGLVKGGTKKKSSVCVDSAMEFMSEMEKNRLFWETCLAS